MMTPLLLLSFFFFNDTATTEIYTLSLHDALPISHQIARVVRKRSRVAHRVRNGDRLARRVTGGRCNIANRIHTRNPVPLVIVGERCCMAERITNCGKLVKCGLVSEATCHSIGSACQARNASYIP